MSDMVESALQLVTRAHQNQTRKNLAKSPYIEHPIRVKELLEQANIRDPNILAAALLHDVLEDCPDISAQDILEATNYKVLSLVCEVTDNKRFPQRIRKEYQYHQMRYKSSAAQLIKMADKLDNLRTFIDDPPDWSREKIVGYICWAYHVLEERVVLNSYLSQEIKTTFEKLNEIYPTDYSERRLQEYFLSCE